MQITVVQMPAVNTPQFSWVLSRLPRHPQPVPPIYQPEVAARGVVLAADHPGRKEHWVGATTVATIMAQRFAAPLLDRYLARTGFGSQQSAEKEPPTRPDNLWEPADEAPGQDHGAHGEFDERSHPRSVAAHRHRASRGGRRYRPPRLRQPDRRLPRQPARRRPPALSVRPSSRRKSPQETWSEATSQQTDQDALQAAKDTPEPEQAPRPPTPRPPRAPRRLRLPRSPAEPTLPDVPDAGRDPPVGVGETDLKQPCPTR